MKIATLAGPVVNVTESYCAVTKLGDHLESHDVAVVVFDRKVIERAFAHLGDLRYTDSRERLELAETLGFEECRVAEAGGYWSGRPIVTVKKNQVIIRHSYGYAMGG